jgi:hypothetical protein
MSLLSRSAVAAVALLILVVPGAAVADPPTPYEPPEAVHLAPEDLPAPASCPAAPEQLEEHPESVEQQYSDELVELRWVRIAQAHFCEAVADRQDLARKRLNWLLLEASEANGQRQLSNEKLTALVEAAGEPSPVEFANADQVVSAIDSSGEAQKAGLWSLFGVFLVGLLAYPVYKAFVFWREHV